MGEMSALEKANLIMELINMAAGPAAKLILLIRTSAGDREIDMSEIDSVVAENLKREIEVLGSGALQ
jgi:predicted nucleotidyltransferase